MEDSTTLQVDADEISDEVIESLVEEGGISREEAQEFGDEVWFEEVETEDPNKVSAVEYLSIRYKNLEEASAALKELFTDYKTVYGDVEEVNRKYDDKIQLKVRHPKVGRERLLLSAQSEELANLMEYKQADNPKELEGCKLLILPSTFDSRNSTVVVPHNVSGSGRIRFGLYSALKEVQQKTRVSMISDNPDTVFNGLGGTLIPSMLFGVFGIIVYGIFSELGGLLVASPTFIWILVTLSVLVYGLGRGLLALSQKIVSSDFNEL